MRANIGLALRRIGAGNLLVLPPPRTGLLAVLWWAGIVAFVMMAGAYTVLSWLQQRRGGKLSPGFANPCELKLWAWLQTKLPKDTSR